MNILMGFDGSWHSDRALRWALHEASARGATVTVLEVFHIGGAGGSPEAATSSRDQRAIARRHVEHALTRAGPIANGVATTIEVSGRAGSTSTAAVLLERARHYDLLVVGARGLGGFAGSLLGSVSQQVTAHADIPVAVIPAASGEAAANEELADRSIVVGVDGSSGATEALRWAIDAAKAQGCAVTAVYVYPPPAATLTSDILVGLDHAILEQFWTRTQHAAQQELADLVAKEVAGTDVAVDCRATPGTPVHRLLQKAAGHAGPLVVGSRGHGGFAGLLLGSVSQQCVLHSPIPVVVVHSRT